MLHFPHLRHQISHLHELRMRVSTRADHVHILRTLRQSLRHLLTIQNLVADYVIDFVKYHEIVFAAVNLLASKLPAFLAKFYVLWIRFRAANFDESAAHWPDFEFVIA